MIDNKNPFDEQEHDGETIDVEYTETDVESINKANVDKNTDAASQEKMDQETDDYACQQDNTMKQATEDEVDSQEEKMESDSESQAAYEQQIYDWTEHKVNPYESVKEESKVQEEDEKEYNVNFSTEGPKAYNSAAKPKKKKHTGAIIAASFVGIFMICVVITGSVYMGYAIGRYVDKNGTTGQVALNEPNQSIDLSNKADTVNVVKSPLTAPEIVQKVAPSVVAINTKVQVNRGYMPTYGEAEGSGFFYGETADAYYIATNNHVIDGAQQISVTLKGQYFKEGESFPAAVKGRDPITDLAILVVKKSDVSEKASAYIKTADIGSSDDLVVGEFALAIGNPLGLGETVTGGIISAINREVKTETGQHTVIQTDAAINPGNSGGALVNGTGQIVGINTLKIGQTSVEGIGFAIPIDTAKPILDDIIKNGDVKRPYMGIAGQDVTGDLSKLYGLPIGVFIAEVTPGSPADLGGIKAQDVIVGIDDSFVTNMNDLKDIIQKKKVGDKMQVNLIREGQRLSVSIELQGR